MMTNTIVACLIVLLLGNQCYADEMDIRTAFDGIEDRVSAAIELRNTLGLQTRGGHLQGIQRLRNNLVVSGSSSDYAYLAVVSLVTFEVSRIERLRTKPLKHAGGFQISDGWMAIGVEDNDARTRSEILVYKDWSGITALPAPAATVYREGAYQRATAGAVGITSAGSRLWLVVGDWDSMNLDFYSASSEDLDFTLLFSVDTEQLDRAQWKEKRWASYQNLNLFADSEGLWLIGTTSAKGRSSGKAEIADLYQIDVEDQTLIKVSARQFETQSGNHFRWGAGLHRAADGTLSLLVTPKNIEDTWVIKTYQSRLVPTE